MPLIMDVPSAPPISRDLEALYRSSRPAATTTTTTTSDAASSHPVVTIPTTTTTTTTTSTRGRETVSSPVRRSSRSLSAPRTHTRAADLVQNLYNRMGVSYAYGQGTDLTANSSALLVDSETVERARSRPTSSARKSPETAPPYGVSSSHRHAVELGSRHNNNNVHDRYRPSSSSRGRTSERLSVEAQLQEAPTISRTRSLSRGRVTPRWPPVRTADPFVRSFVPVIQTSSSFGGASPPRGSPPVAPRPSPTRRPTWMEAAGSYQSSSHGTSNNNNNNNKEVPAEEKKEESAPDGATTPVSMKERIRLYGSQAGIVLPQAIEQQQPPKGRFSVRRSVDPAYAAQFAVRDHPPKIDIFRQGSVDAATDTSSASPTTVRTTTTPKKAGGLAQAYMSSISPAAAKAPPREIAVADLQQQQQQLQPTDSHSVAGLSTMSGDDNYSSQGGGGSKAVVTTTKRNTWRKPVAASTPPPPAPPPLVSEALVERLLEERVEERVKMQMAQLEEKMDERLRLLVRAMEERVMLRLDSLERKLITGGSLD